MGNSQFNITSEINETNGKLPIQTNSKALQTPILTQEEEDSIGGKIDGSSFQQFPIPSGREYDLIDSIAAELPSIIDDETKQQVQGE